MRYQRIQARPGEAGERLDLLLARRFGRSRSALRAKLRGGVLSESGQPLKFSHRLRAGEIVRVAVRENPEPQVEVRYRILYGDEWILAVDKGAGAPVHPVRSFRTRTLLTRLRQDLSEPALGPAHRLDRETSGVLLLARTKTALAALMEQFRVGAVQKRYLAVVRGRPDFERTTVDLPLGRDERFPISCRMRVKLDGGRPAVTEFIVLEKGRDRALLAALPRTGRQHQIRVHLAELGHPLLGDKLYQEEGRPYLEMIGDGLCQETLSRLGHHRHALHAESLRLAHPRGGQELVVSAELAEDLRGLLS